MSNAISQNATDLALSGIGDITPDSIKELVVRYATRSIKGVTRERYMLNNGKLMHSVCEHIRSQLGQSKGRLPDEIGNQIQSAINEYTVSQINRINPANVLSQRVYFAYNKRNRQVVEKVAVVGENMLTLLEQKKGIDKLIDAAEKQLEKMKLNLNSFTREKGDEAQSRIEDMKLTKLHIEMTIEKLKPVLPAAE